MAQSTMNPINRLLVGLSLIGLVFIAVSQFPVSLSSPVSGSSNGSSSSPSPYWRRPGCFRVGHTRTISIPGCVKFNLSTNACRGYCMSYSIPATGDIGSSDPDDLIQSQSNAFILSSLFGQSSEDEPKQSPLLIVRDSSSMMIPNQEKSTNEQPGSLFSDHLKSIKNQLQIGSSSVSSSSSDETGDSSDPDRREVVSVGQCCNMMETEDVLVNLRCGINEIRRLVFKSAKKCECFFCKHV